MVLLLVFMQLTRDLFAIAKFLLSSSWYSLIMQRLQQKLQRVFSSSAHEPDLQNVGPLFDTNAEALALTSFPCHFLLYSDALL